MFAPFLCSVPLSVAIFFAATKPPQKRIFTPIGARSSSGNYYQRQKCRLTLASLAPPLNLKIFPDVFKFNIRKIRNQQACLFINLVARMSTLIRHTKNSGSRCRFNSVGGIFNHHAMFFGFSSEFGSQKKNLRMRFGFLKISAAYLSDKIFFKIEFFEHPVDRIHVSGRCQNEFDAVCIIMYNQIFYAGN